MYVSLFLHQPWRTWPRYGQTRTRTKTKIAVFHQFLMKWPKHGALKTNICWIALFPPFEWVTRTLHPSAPAPPPSVCPTLETVKKFARPQDCLWKLLVQPAVYSHGIATENGQNIPGLMMTCLVVWATWSGSRAEASHSFTSLERRSNGVHSLSSVYWAVWLGL